MVVSFHVISINQPYAHPSVFQRLTVGKMKDKSKGMVVLDIFTVILRKIIYFYNFNFFIMKGVHIYNTGYF